MEEPNDPIVNRLAQIVSERGYLVVASAHPHRIGDVIQRIIHKMPSERLEQPVKIIAETNLEDFAIQGKFVYGSGKPPHPAYRYFYRCITD